MNDKLSANTTRELDALKIHWRAAVMLVVAVLSMYCLASFVSVGWITYGLSVFSLLMMCVTCLGRLNDIGTDKVGHRWNMRRLGFVMVGLSTVTLLGMPLLGAMDAPSWSEVFLRWGVMLVWLTTPGMPPWTKWIWDRVFPHEVYDGPERRASR